MLLTITKTKATSGSIAIGGAVGVIRSGTTSYELTIDQLEHLRPTLVHLAASGIISWSTSATPSTADNGAEGATTSLAEAVLRETGGPTTLAFGAIPDGDYLIRTGTHIVGGVGTPYSPSPRFDPSVTLPQFADEFTVDSTNDNWNPTSWATLGLFFVESVGFSGARITGAVALPHGTARQLVNISTDGPDGIVVLRHEDSRSTAANRFRCPNDTDYLLPKNGVVWVIYNATMSRWFVCDSSPRQMRMVTYALNLYPQLHMPAITGTIDAYYPTPTNAGNRTAPSGLGVAGIDVNDNFGSLWTMTTVDGTGAILSGMKYIGHVDPNPSGWGPVRWLMNNGPGPITLKSQSSADTLDRIYTPNNVDYVLLPNACVSLIARDPGGWAVVAQGIQPTQAITQLSTQLELLSGYVTPAALTGGGGTTNDWNPTGATLVAGNGMPTTTHVRGQSAGGTANVTGIVGPGIGSGFNPRMRLVNFAGSIVLKYDSGSSAAGNRIYCPGAVDFTVHVLGAVDLQYDHLVGHWFVMAP